MPWDCRASTKNRYYTRTIRQNGKRVRQYVGRGPEAEAAARQDAQRRTQRQAGYNAARQDQAALASAEAPLKALSASLDLLTKAVLLTNGYYLTDGHWRRRHESKRKHRGNVNADSGDTAVGRASGGG